MGTNLILKARICLKSYKLPSPARFMCTKDSELNFLNRDFRRKNSGQIDTKTLPPNRVKKQGTSDGRGKKSGVSQLHPFAKSVFAAGTAKRTAELMKRRDPEVPDDEMQHDEEKSNHRKSSEPGKMQSPKHPLSPGDWRKLKESLGNPERFDIRMMNALFTSGSELNIAKSLLTYVVTETGTLTYKLLLRYLTLCVSGGHDDEVFDVYSIMRGSFPSLETGASSLFIKSFSRTARWKEALGILHEIKKVFTPTSRNYGDVIAAAVLHGDTNTAWALYDELLEKGMSPHQETWDVLFTGAMNSNEREQNGSMNETEQQERLLSVLLHMRNNQIYPRHGVANKIKAWFESIKSQEWTGNWTSASPKGVCRCCGSGLESIQLTADEYQELKDRVMIDVIQGRDVFNKTTPEELERFKVFVKTKPPFDVVIDGLNVANVNKDRSKMSDTLLAVVSDLQRQKLNVLVLGRKHMLRPSRSWDRNQMSLIQQKAHCFFTDNISEDDPFLLYATLHSGNHCRFVSRDLMRDHKACLVDGATRRLFFKWQRGHQMVLGGSVTAGRVRFQHVPSYDTIVQTSGDSWHIPYDDTEDRSTYEVPQRWLCLTKKH